MDVQVGISTQKFRGPDDTNYGLICRYQDKNNFYNFLISSDGYFSIIRVQDGVETILGFDQYAYSDVIKQVDSLNTILASCDGDDLALTVNGQELLSVKDDQFQSGDVGMILETRTDGGASVIFKDFYVTKK